MITAEDAVALCVTLAKYQKTLEKEIERQILFQKKYPRFEANHKIREEATQKSLDTFKSLTGVRSLFDSKAECGCPEDDVSSAWCDCYNIYFIVE